MSEERGFKINGKLFPFVAYPDWRNRDYALARQLTGVTTEQLFDDPILLEQALVAVAVSRESPAMDRGAVVAYVGELRPDDVEEVGFETEERPSPLPPEEPNGNDGSS